MRAQLEAPQPATEAQSAAPGFHSILFDRPQPEIEAGEAPAFFGDLNLDQLFAAVAAGREEYNLQVLFCEPLHDIEAVAYRHEVLRDLEQDALRSQIMSFAQRMRDVRAHLSLAQRLHYRYEKASWLLYAAQMYCEAVGTLASDLGNLELRSRGLSRLRAFLCAYVGSDDFARLAADASQLRRELAAVTYRLNINGNRVTVSKYEGEPDYSVEVEQTFAKFRQGAAQDYRVRLPDQVNLNHVEAAIVELVARLYPDLFQRLLAFSQRHGGFIDPRIRRFDREVQFYLAYLEFIQPLKRAGLAFCYPEVSDHSKDIQAYDTFDLALANRLRQDGATPVRNDFFLKERERIVVVSGPNQGGKTTFARMFGQLHYLASLGYPVPGRDARLFLCDRLFTHFEKQERLENLRGKLQDELVRIRDILQQATGNSIVILNESFASTTVEDALFLGKEVMRQLIERDVLGVYVTFLDELASLSEATVSMVSTVVPQNPAQRTYRIVRKRADGLAYAMALAEKHQLTYSRLKRRLQR
jgi:DNA mismatch repair protein MutS